MTMVKDGFADRLLVCTIQPKLLLEKELDEWTEVLDSYTLQSFHTVYEQIFNYHKEKNIHYRFNDDAYKMYVEYSDAIVQEMNDSWEAGEMNDKNYSKDKRNLARLCLGIHIFTTVVDKFISLDSEELMILNEADIPLTIKPATFIFAKEIICYFRAQREVLNKVCDVKAKNDIADYQICEKLLNFLKNAIATHDYSNYLIIRNDGIVLRFNDAPDCQLNEKDLKSYLVCNGYNKNTKAYYFGDQRKRGYLLPWDMFKEEDANALRSLEKEKENQSMDGANEDAGILTSHQNQSSIIESSLSSNQPSISNNGLDDLTTEELMEKGLLYAKTSNESINDEEDLTEFNIQRKKMKLDSESVKGSKQNNGRVSKEIDKLTDYWKANGEAVSGKRVSKKVLKN